MSDDLIGLIENVRFTPVRAMEGYDMGEVDQFLDKLVGALTAGGPVVAMIDGVDFTTTRWREGYDVGDVDRLLQRVREESGGGPVVPPSPTAEDSRSPRPDVVSEQSGLLSRLFGRRGTGS
ncbi:MAG: DivIVA domain-containing protein [Nocardioides sp.]